MENAFNNWYFDVAFDVAILKKDKQEFEDFFCNIMELYDKNFIKVKACGKMGDFNCDGYNNITREFYCCYAPEDITNEKTIKNATKKIQNDIKGLLNKWKNVNSIIYVINDKDRGLAPLILQTFDALKTIYVGMPIKNYLAKDVKEIFMNLNESDKKKLLGFTPEFKDSYISTVNFDIISKIIKHIELNSNITEYEDNYIVPDFNLKIDYNNIDNRFRDCLNFAKYNINQIEDFFIKNPNYDAQILKNFLTNLYLEAKNIYSDEVEDYPNKRFVYMWINLSYSNKTSVLQHALVIMAKYFESCDIFEKPLEEK